MSHAVLAATKLAIALRGLRIDESARALLAGDDAAPNSLEVIVDGALRVSAPIDVTGAAAAPFRLAGERGRYWLTDPDHGAGHRFDVQIASRPRFYSRRTSSGIPMRRLASVVGDTLLVHPGGTCGFSAQGGPCRFCVEGARGRREPLGSVADVVDVVRTAFEEGVAELVLLNSDAFDVETGGLEFLMPYVETIRRHFDTLVALQVHPPRADRWIDWAYAQGVDAISFNLEIFDPHLLDRHCVGRMRYIGRDRYLEALAHAASVFPSGTVWSDLVLGLEPIESTQAGIDTLVDLGVLPVVSTPRTLGGPPLEAAALGRVLDHLHVATRRQRINMAWIQELVTGVTPLEAQPDGAAAALTRTVHGLTRYRLGALATRGLARFRRRLRVRTISDSFDSSHL
jgi:hypothetical protein